MLDGGGMDGAVGRRDHEKPLLGALGTPGPVVANGRCVLYCPGPGVLALVCVPLK